MEIQSQTDEDSDTEEFLYRNQASCATDLYLHPQLDSDVEAVRALYSDTAVSVREYGTIDDVDVNLHINVNGLDEEVAKAWKVDRSEPIVIRLHFSLSQYLDGPVPSVEVFQSSGPDRFSLGLQLQNILRTFISQEWKDLTNENITVQQKSRHTWFRPGGTIKRFRARLSIWSPRSKSNGLQELTVRGRSTLPELRANRLMNRTTSYTIKNPKGELFTYTSNGKRVVVPAVKSSSQLTTKQLIELLFSSQAIGHCKAAPTLQHGFLVQEMEIQSQTDEDTDTEEFLYRNQASCATDLYLHPQLDSDVEAVRALYSDTAVSVREYGTIDDVDVNLHINVNGLDEEVAKAWKVDRSEPIVIRLHFSLSQYLDGPVPSVEVFQSSGPDRFSLGLQLQNILRTFISQEWKDLTNENITVQQKSRHTWFRPGGTIKRFRARLSIWSPRSKSNGLQELTVRGRSTLPELRANRLMNRTTSYTIKNPKGELFTYTSNGKRVVVPAVKSSSQLTTKQLIELLFSSQAIGHCKAAPTLQHGFLVQEMEIQSQTDEDTDTEEFLYRNQASCATDLYLHPQLDSDVEAVRALYSDTAVSVREYGTIDDVDVNLHINVNGLDEEVAKAWKVDRSEPIVIRLHFSLSQYLDGPVPSVEVFQSSGPDRFSLGLQLQNILRTFISQEWKDLTNENITVQQKSRHTWFRPGGTIKRFRARLSIWSPRSKSNGLQELTVRGRSTLPELRANRLMNRTTSYTIKNPKGELFTYTSNGKRVVVPAVKSSSQLTTKQLIELLFSSQAIGHCKAAPTLQHGFLVQAKRSS